jgi:hypothetical protein
MYVVDAEGGRFYKTTTFDFGKDRQPESAKSTKNTA